MRLVLEGLPVSSPLETKVHSEHANRSVLCGFWKISAALEYANIKRNAEIMV
jgi:hypothetical protein